MSTTSTPGCCPPPARLARDRYRHRRAYHDPNALSDLNVFDAEYGYPTLSACTSGPPFTATTGACFYQADPEGIPATNSNWIVEESLDIEWAHAEAPGATIVLVETVGNDTGDLLNGVEWANENGATEVSMSWESNEASGEANDDALFDATSTSSGAPILYTASAGDNGHAAAYPAASPNVIGVGGTTLNGCSSTSCAGFTGETAWSGSGGGVSAFETIPAYQSAYNGPVYNEPSGGISALTGGMRAVPDVSFDADPNTGLSVYDSTAYKSSVGLVHGRRHERREPELGWDPGRRREEWRPGSAQESLWRRLRELLEGRHERNEWLVRHRLHGRNRLRPRHRAGQSNQLSAFGDPPGGATPDPPHFYNGNVEGIRDAGSDSTLSMMQKIGDLFTGAGLYGCTLNFAAGQTLYNSSDPASATANGEDYCQSGANISTTDVDDNWDRTEVTEGVDDAGSSAGQSQLCGPCRHRCRWTSPDPPFPLKQRARRWRSWDSPKTGSRSSTTRSTPAIYGTSTTAPYSSMNGGVVGPVAKGWLPGDPTSGPYTGTALGDIDNDGGAPARPTGSGAPPPPRGARSPAPARSPTGAR